MGTVATCYSSAYYTDPSFWDEIRMTVIEPKWFGPGCHKLGYTGPITPAVVDQAMNGRSIDGSGVLLIRSASVGRTRFGTEILFCAPPGVSALLGPTPITQWDRIFQAHVTSRDKTLDGFMSQPHESRCGAGGIIRTPCSPAGIAFTHGYSRRGTPFIHDHDIVLKAGFCPADGKARAVEMDPVFQQQRQLRANYQLFLSNECVQTLGVPIERTGNSFRPVGMTDAYLTEMTPGKSEIGRYLVDRNVRDTPAARDLANKILRPDKQTYEPGLLAVHWATIAEKHQIAVTIAPTATPTVWASPANIAKGQNARELQAYVLASATGEKLADRHIVFDVNRYRLEATRNAFGSGLTPADLDKAIERVLQRPEAFGLKVIDRGTDQSPLYTAKSPRVLVVPQRPADPATPESKEPSVEAKAKPIQPETPPSKPLPMRDQSPPKAEEPRPDAQRVADDARHAKRNPSVTPETDSRPSPDPKPSSLRERVSNAAQELWNRIAPDRVITVRADLPASHRHSLDRLIVDTQQTSLPVCHARVYDRVWGKWFSNTDQMLQYAEKVFEQERQPKQPLNGRTTIVVEKADLAPDGKLEKIRQIAERHGASVNCKPSPQSTPQHSDRTVLERSVERAPSPPPPPPAPAPAMSR